jgi:hypothetical protein
MDLNWHKSSYSGNSTGNCVEIAPIPAGTAIRDSKNPTGPTLRFPAAAWQPFLTDLPD